MGDAVILALGAAGFFGLALVLTPLGLRHLPPVHGAAVSVSTTAAALLIVSAGLLDWTAATLPAALVFAGIGALFPASVTVLTFSANRRLGPHVTGALGNLAPLFAVLFAAALLGEVPGPLQALGILVIVAGATLLVTATAHGGGTMTLALLLPLGAAVIRGLVQPAVKIGYATWPSPYAAATIGYAVSAAVVLLLLGLRGGLPQQASIRQPGALWFAAVGLCNGAAVLTMYAALARGPVALVAPLVAAYPIATLVLGAVFLRGVRIGRRVILGVAVTVAGVALLLAVR